MAEIYQENPDNGRFAGEIIPGLCQNNGKILHTDNH